jgi:DNA replication protein DnaC
MLLEQTFEKLAGLRLHGMTKALRQWQEGPRDMQLEPADLVGLLADAEWTHRENNKLTSRLRKAKFKFKDACIEDILYRPGRGLMKTTINELSSSTWVTKRKTIILTGPTGAGKSYLACALGQKACRDGFSVLYKRNSRLFDELTQARADGTYASCLRGLLKAAVLILDDFCMQPLTPKERRDLIDVLEDRTNVCSTVISSQLEPEQWHAAIGDETTADSICDRLVHGAHRIKLGGESIRKVLADAECTDAKEETLTKRKRSGR